MKLYLSRASVAILDAGCPFIPLDVPLDVHEAFSGCPFVALDVPSWMSLDVPNLLKCSAKLTHLLARILNVAVLSFVAVSYGICGAV